MAVFGLSTLSTNVTSNMSHPFTVTVTLTRTLTPTITLTQSIITTTPTIVLVLLRINNCLTEFVYCIDQSAFSTFCLMVMMMKSLITISIQKTEVGQD